MFRFDACAEIGKLETTKDGFLKGRAVATRTGIFEYLNADGTIRRELRLPEEVFSPESIASLQMIPVTNLHPKEFVNADNARRLVIGSTGENAAQEEISGQQVLTVPFAITHRDGIDSAKKGRTQLSLGYSLDLDPTPGQWNGQNYDAIQRNIRYNHLAIVDSARAGSVASFHVDAADEDAVSVELKNLYHNDGGMSMKVTINGVEVEVPDLVGNHIAAQVQRGDAAETRATNAEAERDRAIARADEAEAKIGKPMQCTGKDDCACDACKKKNADAAIEARVKERVALLTTAKAALPAEKFNELQNADDRAVMSAVIMAKHPQFNADGKSDDYLKARFDAVTEAPAQEPQQQQQRSNAQQQAQFNADSNNNQQNNDAFDFAAAYARQNASYTGKQ